MLKIDYPIFSVTADVILRKDGVVFGDGKVIDDTNISSNLLGVRRLKTHLTPKYILNRPVFDISEMISRGSQRYIDSSGKLFNYEKKFWINIRYHKIKRLLHKTNFSVVTFQDLNYRLTITRPPPGGYQWVGIMYLGEEPWELYDYSQEKHKAKRKMI